MKRHQLNMLNRRVAELQEAGKWGPLKRLRHKRRNVTEYYDRLDAICIARMAERDASMVAVGYPKGIKYESYRGNAKAHLRRLLARWSYNRIIRYIQEECAERGVRAEAIHEAWTSRRCHRCSSLKTRRMGQSFFWCLNCGLQYNADWNGAINIGSALMPQALSRRATVGLAHAGDEQAQEK